MTSSLVFVLRPEWKAMVLPPTATAELNPTKMRIQSNCFYISVQPAQIDALSSQAPFIASPLMHRLRCYSLPEGMVNGVEVKAPWCGHSLNSQRALATFAASGRCLKIASVRRSQPSMMSHGRICDTTSLTVAILVLSGSAPILLAILQVADFLLRQHSILDLLVIATEGLTSSL